MSEHSCNGKVIEDLVKDRDLWKHRAEELVGVVKELNTLNIELRRTIDKDHWYADDLDGAVKLATDQLAKFDALKAGQEKGEK